MATQNGQDSTGTLPSQFKRRWQQFNDWRTQRPFLGGVMLCLAGLLITWVPMQILPDLLFIGGEVAGFLAIGTMFGVFVFLTGVYALYKPEHSTEIGVVGIVLSILSLFGSLGGLLFGLLFGIIGGNLCFAWEPTEDVSEDAPSESDTVDESRAEFSDRLRRIARQTARRLRSGLETITRRVNDD
jgi:hypothetical protein